MSVELPVELGDALVPPCFGPVEVATSLVLRFDLGELVAASVDLVLPVAHVLLVGPQPPFGLASLVSNPPSEQAEFGAALQLAPADRGLLLRSLEVLLGSGERVAGGG